MDESHYQSIDEEQRRYSDEEQGNLYVLSKQNEFDFSILLLKNQ